MLHKRLRVCEPPPHVTLQPLQTPHVPQFPLTGTTAKTDNKDHKPVDKGSGGGGGGGGVSNSSWSVSWCFEPSLLLGIISGQKTAAATTPSV